MLINRKTNFCHILCHTADEEPNLPTKPYEIKSHMYVPAGTFATRLRGVLTDRLSVAQYHNFLKGFQLHNCYLENEHFHRWKGKMVDMVVDWEYIVQYRSLRTCFYKVRNKLPHTIDCTQLYTD